MCIRDRDLSECGGLLQFYMPVTFDPDAVFGTHVATAENDDWLNVYAAYDLNACLLYTSAGRGHYRGGLSALCIGAGPDGDHAAPGGYLSLIHISASPSRSLPPRRSILRAAETSL